MKRVPGRLDRWFMTPMAAVLLALALIALSVVLAIYNEGLRRETAEREAQVQAEILAGSLAAPIAFDDRAATQEYVNALRANPAIEAAAAYDIANRQVAGFRRDGAPAPEANRLGPPRFDAGKLIVTATVSQGTLKLGSVYLRLTTEPLIGHATRYVGIGGIVLMASLLVAVLGRSRARLSESNRRLQQETADRERVEEALRQSQKMEAMGQLTGGVAHDFNNLLMVASSGLDLLARTDDPVRRERLQAGMRQAIDRGAALTQQLLAFARRTPVQPEVIDLGASLHGMRTLLERSLREDITVDLRPSPGLWRVEVDPSQLEVAILNVAINARDAMPQGGSITIIADNVPAEASEGAGDVVRLCIVDTGVGLSPDLVSRVFEPFFTTKGVGQGTGLGLSQVYGFARASGGTVRFDSVEGKGSTICIELPRTHKPAPLPLDAHAAAGEAQRGGRILLVEDDDHVAELVVEMLQELGYQSRRATDAHSALELLETPDPVDLVFSDMVMPGEMSGLDLALEIAHRRPGLPIILTTGYSDAAKAARERGIRLLLKPYRIEALAEQLEAVMGSRPPR